MMIVTKNIGIFCLTALTGCSTGPDDQNNTFTANASNQRLRHCPKTVDHSSGRFTCRFSDHDRYSECICEKDLSPQSEQPGNCELQDFICEIVESEIPATPKSTARTVTTCSCQWFEPHPFEGDFDYPDPIVCAENDYARDCFLGAGSGFGQANLQKNWVRNCGIQYCIGERWSKCEFNSAVDVPCPLGYYCSDTYTCLPIPSGGSLTPRPKQ